MEKNVEKYLMKRSREIGGECMKWTGTLGVPDRIMLLPGGRVIFVEVKQKSGRLSKMQIFIHSKLQRLGMDVRVVWCNEDVDQLIDSIYTE